MKNIRLHHIHIEDWWNAQNVIEHVETVPVTLGDEAILHTADIKFSGLVKVEVATDYFKTFMFRFSVYSPSERICDIENTINTVISSFKNKTKIYTEVSVIASLIYNNSTPLEEPEEVF